MTDWRGACKWAASYLPEIERVLRSQAHHIIDISVATKEKDSQFATDYEIKVTSGDVACRVRKWEYWQRFGDFTLRHILASGQETETAKIKRGHGDWYLYAWAKSDEVFGSWVFVDLDKLWGSNLINTARIISNLDNRDSKFIGITLHDLRLHDCIVASGGEAAFRASKGMQYALFT